MSKARLIITAVVIEGRSQAEVARDYQVSKAWVSKLVARYRAEGDTAFEPRSRRPHTSPGSLDPTVVELIVKLRNALSAQGLDAGTDTIAWHLEHHHHIKVSTSTGTSAGPGSSPPNQRSDPSRPTSASKPNN